MNNIKNILYLIFCIALSFDLSAQNMDPRDSANVIHGLRELTTDEALDQTNNTGIENKQLTELRKTANELKALIPVAIVPNFKVFDFASYPELSQMGKEADKDKMLAAMETKIMGMNNPVVTGYFLIGKFIDSETGKVDFKTKLVLPLNFTRSSNSPCGFQSLSRADLSQLEFEIQYIYNTKNAFINFLGIKADETNNSALKEVVTLTAEIAKRCFSASAKYLMPTGDLIELKAVKSIRFATEKYYNRFLMGWSTTEINNKGESIDIEYLSHIDIATKKFMGYRKYILPDGVTHFDKEVTNEYYVEPKAMHHGGGTYVVQYYDQTQECTFNVYNRNESFLPRNNLLTITPVSWALDENIKIKVSAYIFTKEETKGINIHKECFSLSNGIAILIFRNLAARLVNNEIGLNDKAIKFANELSESSFIDEFVYQDGTPKLISENGRLLMDLYFFDNSSTNSTVLANVNNNEVLDTKTIEAAITKNAELIKKYNELKTAFGNNKIDEILNLCEQHYIYNGKKNIFGKTFQKMAIDEKLKLIPGLINKRLSLTQYTLEDKKTYQKVIISCLDLSNATPAEKRDFAIKIKDYIPGILYNTSGQELATTAVLLHNNFIFENTNYIDNLSFKTPPEPNGPNDYPGILQEQVDYLYSHQVYVHERFIYGKFFDFTYKNEENWNKIFLPRAVIVNNVEYMDFIPYTISNDEYLSFSKKNAWDPYLLVEFSGGDDGTLIGEYKKINKNAHQVYPAFLLFAHAKLRKETVDLNNINALKHTMVLAVAVPLVAYSASLSLPVIVAGCMEGASVGTVGLGVFAEINLGNDALFIAEIFKPGSTEAIMSEKHRELLMYTCILGNLTHLGYVALTKEAASKIITETALDGFEATLPLVQNTVKRSVYLSIVDTGRKLIGSAKSSLLQYTIPVGLLFSSPLFKATIESPAAPIAKVLTTTNVGVLNRCIDMAVTINSNGAVIKEIIAPVKNIIGAEIKVGTEQLANSEVLSIVKARCAPPTSFQVGIAQEGALIGESTVSTVAQADVYYLKNAATTAPAAADFVVVNYQLGSSVAEEIIVIGSEPGMKEVEQQRKAQKCDACPKLKSYCAAFEAFKKRAKLYSPKTNVPDKICDLLPNSSAVLVLPYLNIMPQFSFNALIDALGLTNTGPDHIEKYIKLLSVEVLKTFNYLYDKNKPNARVSWTTLTNFAKLNANVQAEIIQFTDAAGLNASGKPNSTLINFCNDLTQPLVAGSNITFLSYVNDPQNIRIVKAMVDHHANNQDILQPLEVEEVGEVIAIEGLEGLAKYWVNRSNRLKQLQENGENGRYYGKRAAVALLNGSLNLTIPNITQSQYKVFREVHLWVNKGATPPQYMVADILLVKYKADNSTIDDVIICESKLSGSTDYTKRQKQGWRLIHEGAKLEVKAPVRNLVSSTPTQDDILFTEGNQNLSATTLLTIDKSKVIRISDAGSKMGSFDINHILVSAFYNHISQN
jgi:hypothetical protein